MKKKLLLIILITLLFVSGCGNGKNNISNKSDKVEVKVEDLSIDLNFSGSFNKMNYKYPEKAISGNMGTYAIMDYMNGNEFVFRIAMYYFENKKEEEVMKESNVISKTTKEINDKKWTIYNINEDDKNVITYAYEYDGSTYTIGFISEKNIDNFIDAFMSKVNFK